MPYTTDDLLVSVKKSTGVTQAASKTINTEILQYAQEEIDSDVLPLISALRQDFLIVAETLTLVNGRVQIPARAVGRAIVSVKYVDTMLTYVDEEFTGSAAGNPQMFQVESDEIVTYPLSNSQITVKYLQRPSTLVETKTCAKVISKIEVSGNTVLTVSNATSDNSTLFAIGQSLDICSQKQGNLLKAKDLAVLAFTTSTLTFAGENLNIVTGDWLSLAETSCVIPFPQEVYPLISALTQGRVLKSIDDQQAYQLVMDDVKKKRQNIMSLLGNRIQSQPAKIVNKYRLR